jgi:hypothetical protein
VQPLLHVRERVLGASAWFKGGGEKTEIRRE